jgi:hypothetical protein
VGARSKGRADRPARQQKGHIITDAGVSLPVA